MAVVDVVSWSAPDDMYAWKYPSDELSTWTQLVVSESQEAVLMKEGQMVGPFRAGRHTLDTDNVPFLTTLLKIPMGGKSPFMAQVWFVNRTQPLDVRWGTSDPIQLQDPRYDIMLPVRAFGQYGVQVSDTRKFLIKLVGTMRSFDRSYLISYFRGIILTRAKDTIAKFIVERKVSILEISAHLNEISELLQKIIEPELEEFGLQMIRFTVNSISTPEDDPAVSRLKDALAKKAEYRILDTNVQQMRSFDVMSQAAGNTGSNVATPMGAGIGLGIGVGLAGAFRQVTAGLSSNLQTAGIVCPRCQARHPAGTGFCSGCGANLAAPQAAQAVVNETTCSRCSGKFSGTAKFCPHCGNQYRPCQKCGADMPEGAKSCPACGEALPVPCRKCGVLLPSGAKFCLSCGMPTTAQCTKCSQELPEGAKFCLNCGTPVA